MMSGRRSTSQGRRAQRRLSCSGRQPALAVETRVEMPRPQLVEQGLQGLVWAMQFPCQGSTSPMTAADRPQTP